jgi:hypothetical protein
MTTPPPPGPKFRWEPDGTIVRTDLDGTVTRIPPDDRKRPVRPHKVSLVPWWTITGVFAFLVAGEIIGGVAHHISRILASLGYIGIVALGFALAFMGVKWLERRSDRQRGAGEG